MTFIKNVDEALEFVKSEVSKLEKRLDTEVEKPKAFLDYPTTKMLTYGLDSLSDNGEYMSGNYYKPHDCKTVTRLIERKDKLLAALQAYEDSLEETRKVNVDIGLHNQKIRSKVSTYMQELGISSTYRTIDEKSRARNKPTITVNAGYMSDLTRVIPVSDLKYNNIKSQIKTKQDQIMRWYETKHKELTEVERLKAEEELTKKKDLFGATMRVKYGLSYDADERSIRDAILSKDKYLTLAYWMEKNREDWNEGYNYAEVGLGKFESKMDNSNEDDLAISKEISDIIYEDDGYSDGRVFRDCKWNYSVLYSMSDQDVYTDLETYKELFTND